ncbi:MAG: IS21 family transposase [Candidatus Thorarchaeota archaeon]|jgi:transposase
MIDVEDWAEIRRLSKVEKLTKRAIARRLGIHRNTVTRALASDEPPRYQREKRASVLDPYKPKIHALLSEDHTLSGVRVFEIIRDEGYPGKESILRDYLRQVRPEYKPREVYLRMSYEPGQYGQVDWGELPKPVRWQEQWCKVYAFVMVLCYSRLMYLEFSLSNQLFDFLRCHQNGLRFFGGTPKRWVYDNLTSVVKQRRGKVVSFNETFLQFAGYYTFWPHACWPDAPNQKGVVERPMDYIKGNFCPGRYFADFDDLVAQGWTWLQETANARRHRTTRRVPQDMFETQERLHLLPLPPEPFDTDWVLYPQVSKDCVVRVQTNDYSVPWSYAQRYRQLEVRVDGQWVQIWAEGEEIARHARCYSKHQQILDREHYQGLWQTRQGAVFARLEKGFLTAYGQVGRRFYEGLGRKTERLKHALQAILKLERQYAHADIMAALQMAVDHRFFDPLAVEYLLRVATLDTEAVPPTPIQIEIPVEERSLSSYDEWVGRGGG